MPNYLFCTFKMSIYLLFVPPIVINTLSYSYNYNTIFKRKYSIKMNKTNITCRNLKSVFFMGALLRLPAKKGFFSLIE